MSGRIVAGAGAVAVLAAIAAIGSTSHEAGLAPSARVGGTLEQRRGEILSQALRGRVQLAPLREMKSGHAQPVSATVSLAPEELVHDLNRLSSGELLVTIDAMELDLAPDGKDFKALLADGQPALRPINPVLGAATWRWNVTPVHSGDRHLQLFAYIAVKRSDGTIAHYSASNDEPVIDSVVKVHADALQEGQGVIDWVKKEWPVEAPVAAAVSAGLGLWRRRRKKRAAAAADVEVDISASAPDTAGSGVAEGGAKQGQSAHMRRANSENSAVGQPAGTSVPRGSPRRNRRRHS